MPRHNHCILFFASSLLQQNNERNVNQRQMCILKWFSPISETTTQTLANKNQQNGERRQRRNGNKKKSQSKKIEQIGITFEFISQFHWLVGISTYMHLWPLFANISLALFIILNQQTSRCYFSFVLSLIHSETYRAVVLILTVNHLANMFFFLYDNSIMNHRSCRLK